MDRDTRLVGRKLSLVTYTPTKYCASARIAALPEYRPLHV